MKLTQDTLEFEIKNKKSKLLGVFKARNFVEGAVAFFYFFKGENAKKFRKPLYKCYKCN